MTMPTSTSTTVARFTILLTLGCGAGVAVVCAGVALRRHFAPPQSPPRVTCPVAENTIALLQDLHDGPFRFGDPTPIAEAARAEAMRRIRHQKRRRRHLRRRMRWQLRRTSAAASMPGLSPAEPPELDVERGGLASVCPPVNCAGEGEEEAKAQATSRTRTPTEKGGVGRRAAHNARLSSFQRCDPRREAHRGYNYAPLLSPVDPTLLSSASTDSVGLMVPERWEGVGRRSGRHDIDPGERPLQRRRPGKSIDSLQSASVATSATLTCSSSSSSLFLASSTTSSSCFSDSYDTSTSPTHSRTSCSSYSDACKSNKELLAFGEASTNSQGSTYSPRVASSPNELQTATAACGGYPVYDGCTSSGAGDDPCSPPPLAKDLLLQSPCTAAILATPPSLGNNKGPIVPHASSGQPAPPHASASSAPSIPLRSGPPQMQLDTMMLPSSFGGTHSAPYGGGVPVQLQDCNASTDTAHPFLSRKSDALLVPGGEGVETYRFMSSAALYGPPLFATEMDVTDALAELRGSVGHGGDHPGGTCSASSHPLSLGSPGVVTNCSEAAMMCGGGAVAPLMITSTAAASFTPSNQLLPPGSVPSSAPSRSHPHYPSHNNPPHPYHHQTNHPRSHVRTPTGESMNSAVLSGAPPYPRSDTSYSTLPSGMESGQSPHPWASPNASPLPPPPLQPPQQGTYARSVHHHHHRQRSDGCCLPGSSSAGHELSANASQPLLPSATSLTATAGLRGCEGVYRDRSGNDNAVFAGASGGGSASSVRSCSCTRAPTSKPLSRASSRQFHICGVDGWASTHSRSRYHRSRRPSMNSASRYSGHHRRHHSGVWRLRFWSRLRRQIGRRCAGVGVATKRCLSCAWSRAHHSVTEAKDAFKTGLCRGFEGACVRAFRIYSGIKIRWRGAPQQASPECTHLLAGVGDSAAAEGGAPNSTAAAVPATIFSAKKTAAAGTAKSGYVLKSDSADEAITKIIRLLEPTPGRVPTVVVIRAPLGYDVSADAASLWAALCHDSAVEEGLIDIILMEELKTGPLPPPQAASAVATERADTASPQETSSTLPGAPATTAPLPAPGCPLAEPPVPPQPRTTKTTTHMRISFELYPAHMFYSSLLRASVLQEKDLELRRAAAALFGGSAAINRDGSTPGTGNAAEGTPGLGGSGGGGVVGTTPASPQSLLRMPPSCLGFAVPMAESCNTSRNSWSAVAGHHLGMSTESYCLSPLSAGRFYRGASSPCIPGPHCGGDETASTTLPALVASTDGGAATSVSPTMSPASVHASCAAPATPQVVVRLSESYSFPAQPPQVVLSPLLSALTRQGPFLSAASPRRLPSFCVTPSYAGGGVVGPGGTCAGGANAHSGIPGAHGRLCFPGGSKGAASAAIPPRRAISSTELLLFIHVLRAAIGDGETVQRSLCSSEIDADDYEEDENDIEDGAAGVVAGFKAEGDRRCDARGDAAGASLLHPQTPAKLSGALRGSAAVEVQYRGAEDLNLQDLRHRELEPQLLLRYRFRVYQQGSRSREAVAAAVQYVQENLDTWYSEAKAMLEVLPPAELRHVVSSSSTPSLWMSGGSSAMHPSESVLRLSPFGGGGGEASSLGICRPRLSSVLRTGGQPTQSTTTAPSANLHQQNHEGARAATGGSTGAVAADRLRLPAWAMEVLVRRESMRETLVRDLKERAFRVCAIALPDMRVHCILPPAVPRYATAHARGFPLSRTYAEEVIAQQRALQFILLQREEENQRLIAARIREERRRQERRARREWRARRAKARQQRRAKGAFSRLQPESMDRDSLAGRLTGSMSPSTIVSHVASFVKQAGLGGGGGNGRVVRDSVDPFVPEDAAGESQSGGEARWIRVRRRAPPKGASSPAYSRRSGEHSPLEDEDDEVVDHVSPRHAPTLRTLSRSRMRGPSPTMDSPVSMEAPSRVLDGIPRVASREVTSPVSPLAKGLRGGSMAALGSIAGSDITDIPSMEGEGRQASSNHGDAAFTASTTPASAGAPCGSQWTTVHTATNANTSATSPSGTSTAAVATSSPFLTQASARAGGCTLSSHFTDGAGMATQGLVAPSTSLKPTFGVPAVVGGNAPRGVLARPAAVSTAASEGSFSSPWRPLPLVPPLPAATPHASFSPPSSPFRSINGAGYTRCSTPLRKVGSDLVSGTASPVPGATKSLAVGVTQHATSMTPEGESLLRLLPHTSHGKSLRAARPHNSKALLSVSSCMSLDEAALPVVPDALGTTKRREHICIPNSSNSSGRSSAEQRAETPPLLEEDSLPTASLTSQPLEVPNNSMYGTFDAYFGHSAVTPQVVLLRQQAQSAVVAGLTTAAAAVSKTPASRLGPHSQPPAADVGRGAGTTKRSGKGQRREQRRDGDGAVDQAARTRGTDASSSKVAGSVSKSRTAPSLFAVSALDPRGTAPQPPFSTTPPQPQHPSTARPTLRGTGSGLLPYTYSVDSVSSMYGTTHYPLYQYPDDPVNGLFASTTPSAAPLSLGGMGGGHTSSAALNYTGVATVCGLGGAYPYASPGYGSSAKTGPNVTGMAPTHSFGANLSAAADTGRGGGNGGDRIVPESGAYSRSMRTFDSPRDFTTNGGGGGSSSSAAPMPLAAMQNTHMNRLKQYNKLLTDLLGVAGGPMRSGVSFYYTYGDATALLYNASLRVPCDEDILELLGQQSWASLPSPSSLPPSLQGGDGGSSVDGTRYDVGGAHGFSSAPSLMADRDDGTPPRLPENIAGVGASPPSAADRKVNASTSPTRTVEGTGGTGRSLLQGDTNSTHPSCRGGAEEAEAEEDGCSYLTYEAAAGLPDSLDALEKEQIEAQRARNMRFYSIFEQLHRAFHDTVLEAVGGSGEAAKNKGCTAAASAPSAAGKTLLHNVIGGVGTTYLVCSAAAAPVTTTAPTATTAASFASAPGRRGIFLDRRATTSHGRDATVVAGYGSVFAKILGHVPGEMASFSGGTPRGPWRLLQRLRNALSRAGLAIARFMWMPFASVAAVTGSLEAGGAGGGASWPSVKRPPDGVSSDFDVEKLANAFPGERIVSFGEEWAIASRLDMQNGHYGLSPLQVWMATRYSRRFAGEVYLMDVVAAGSDPFYPAVRVLDEVVAHAALYYHNHSLRDFVEDLKSQLGLVYEPQTLWGRRALGLPDAEAEVQELNGLLYMAKRRRAEDEARQPRRRKGQRARDAQTGGRSRKARTPGSQGGGGDRVGAESKGDHKGEPPLLVTPLSLSLAAAKENGQGGDDSFRATRYHGPPHLDLPPPLSPGVLQFSRSPSMRHQPGGQGSRPALCITTQRTGDSKSASAALYGDRDSTDANDGGGDGDGKDADCQPLYSVAGSGAVAPATVLSRDQKGSPSPFRRRLASGAKPLSNEDEGMVELAWMELQGKDQEEDEEVFYGATAAAAAGLGGGDMNMAPHAYDAVMEREVYDERMLLRELDHLKEFLIEHRNVLSSAMLTTTGSNALEAVFGVPATVFPFLLCARESVPLVASLFESMTYHYGALTFDNFSRFAHDAYHRDRPDVLRHTPRTFRMLNKSRRGCITYEELCGWLARKLSCGNNVQPDAHLLATTMSLRLPLTLLAESREEWDTYRPTLKSLSDGDDTEY